MKRVGDITEKLAGKVIVVIGILLFFALSYYSMRYTELPAQGTEIMYTVRDGIGKNILALIMWTGCLYGCKYLFSKRGERKKNIKVVLTVVMALSFLVSVLWVWLSHGKPYGDQAAIYVMADVFIKGNYAPMDVGGYMFLNSQQYGMVFLIEILFRIFGSEAYMSVQYLNAVCIPVLVFAGYQIVHLMFEEEIVELYYLILIGMCVPMYIYVPFVYGEILSITLSALLIWQVLRLCKDNRKSALVWGSLFAGLAVLIRMNALIVVIACGIVVLVHSVKEQNPVSLLLIGTAALTIVSFDMGVKTMYEQRSGMEVEGGTPRILHIAMGMQDTYWGPGWFNNYIYQTFWENEFERDTTKYAAQWYMKGRMREFAEDPAMAVDFYRRKILTQWNEPTCDAFSVTKSFDCPEGELPGVTYDIYYGSLHENVMRFLDRYQFVLYVGVLLLLVSRVKRNCAIYEHILLVTIIGGFLFSVLWEAKSRYILPYMIFLLPLAGAGVYEMQRKVEGVWRRKRSTEKM